MENELLPQKLKELRKANGYTQDYVASFLGVVRQTYSHYETGHRTPSSETLYKLAGLYNVSIEDFMQLIIKLDQTIYYDAPPSTQSGQELSGFLDYVNAQDNIRKLRFLNYMEKELLLETLIKSRGFSDAVVSIGMNSDNVNVFINSSELNYNTALSIYKMLKDEVGVNPGSIIILPVYSQV